MKRVMKERVKRVRRVLEARRPIIYRRVIKRRTYYGLVNLMQEYYKTIIEAFPEDEIRELAKAIGTKEKKEDIITLIQIVFGKHFSKVKELMPKIHDVIFKAYARGSTRVLDKRGNVVIKIDKIKDSPAIQEIMQSQEKYLKNLTRDQVKTVMKVIQKGLEEGWTNEQIADELVKEVKDLTRGRALLIARTEIVKAHNTGLINTMKEAGVKKYRWVATNDRRTCPICKSLDGKVFRVDDPNAPLPVRDTHPNCRCTIVAEG